MRNHISLYINVHNGDGVGHIYPDVGLMCKMWSRGICSVIGEPGREAARGVGGGLL